MDSLYGTTSYSPSRHKTPYKRRKFQAQARRTRKALQRLLVPLLLVASFLLPFTFLLLSHRGRGLASEYDSYDITISKPGQNAGPTPLGVEGANDKPIASGGKPSSSSTTSTSDSERHSDTRTRNKSTTKKNTPRASSSSSSKEKEKKNESDPGTNKDGCLDASVCPLVTSLSPTHGPTVGGSLVTISGENFGLPTAPKKIQVGGRPCSSLASISTTKLTCVVPAGTGRNLPLSIKVNNNEAVSSESNGVLWSYDPPIVSRIDPNHASGKGGAVITIKGSNFGASQSSSTPLVKVGGEACLETHWLSDEALTCKVPGGKGTRLPVQVTICGCGDPSDAMGQQTQTGETEGQEEEEEEEGPSLRSIKVFSYDEDVMQQNSDEVLVELDLQKLNAVALGMNAKLVNLKYEMQAKDVVTKEDIFFAVIPELMTTLPASADQEDLDLQKHETCAIVGRSGSLLDAQYGDLIDDHAAVFRLHNSPTRNLEMHVGSKTTYQVLDHFWMDQLLKATTSADTEADKAAGRSHARGHWVHEGANLVLWSAHSQEGYLALKETFPNMDITWLNPQFTKSVSSAVRLMQEKIERVMGTEFSLSGNSHLSSTLVSVFMAMHKCKGKVDLYGVDMRYSHSGGENGRDSSSSSSEPGSKYLYYKSLYDHGQDQKLEREASALEYLVFLVLKNKGLIHSINNDNKLEEGHEHGRQRDRGGHGISKEEDVQASCALIRKACSVGCNNRGIPFANGTCLCDPIYAGDDCSVNKLEQEASKILKGLNLRYPLEQPGHSICMNREDVNGTRIALPSGITRGKFGKDGDYYHVDRMLYHALPENDQYNPNSKITGGGGDHDGKKSSSLGKSYGSCAIVGNSGSLLRSEHGHDIDAHEMVYRFNQAPVKGFEKHVGSRSTHESLNGYWVKQVLDERRGYKWNWRSRETELVLFELFEPGAFGWKTKSQIVEKDQWWRQSFVRLKQKHQGRKITALSPHFVSWAYQMYRELRRRFQRSHLGRYPGEKPMSGFYAFFFALQVCDEVNVYGFAPWRDPTDKHMPKNVPILQPNDRYHYFDDAKPRPGSHSFDLALYIYKLFAIQFDNVKIYE